MDPKLERQQDFMRRANLFTLEHTFDRWRRRPGTEQAYLALRALGEGKTPKPFALIFGGTGNGKTYLCEAMIITLAARGILCRYWTVAGLMDYLRRFVGDDRPGEPSVEVVTERVSKVPAIVLDDWGVEKGSEWELARLEMIVDYRYRARLLTVLTSNQDVADLARRSERIVSRFSDPDMSQLVLNEGSDFRRR